MVCITPVWPGNRRDAQVEQTPAFGFFFFLFFNEAHVILAEQLGELQTGEVQEEENCSIW